MSRLCWWCTTPLAVKGERVMFREVEIDRDQFVRVHGRCLESVSEWLQQRRITAQPRELTTKLEAS